MKRYEVIDARQNFWKRNVKHSRNKENIILIDGLSQREPDKIFDDCDNFLPDCIHPHCWNVRVECESCKEHPYQEERPRGWWISPERFRVQPRTA